MSPGNILKQRFVERLRNQPGLVARLNHIKIPGVPFSVSSISNIKASLPQISTPGFGSKMTDLMLKELKGQFSGPVSQFGSDNSILTSLKKLSTGVSSAASKEIVQHVNDNNNVTPSCPDVGSQKTRISS